VLAFSCWSGDCQPRLTFFFFLVIKTLFSLCFAALALAPVVSEAAPSRQCGQASWYGHQDGFHGQRTASGERFNAYGATVAHRSLPFGTRLRIYNQANGRSTIARVSDRGPFVYDRVLDLSYGVFLALASPSQGVARICYKIV
jgi:rare lipoprotein A